MTRRLSRAAPRWGATAVVLLTAVLLPLPARAEDIDDGSVPVSVEIEPRTCVTDCGVPPTVVPTPAGELPATGGESLAPLLWLAVGAVVIGAFFIARSRANRRVAPAPLAGPRVGRVASGGTPPPPRTSPPEHSAATGRDAPNEGSNTIA